MWRMKEMSEYPVHCDKCGKYLGYVHATEWGVGLCKECGEEKKDV